MTLRRDPPAGPPTYRRILGCITINLTDLENIVRVLRARTAQVRLRAGDATADEAVDLKDATLAELQRLTISTSSPSIQITLMRDQATVTTSETSIEAKSLVDDAFYLLSQRKAVGAKVRAIWYPIWLASWLISVLVTAILAQNYPLAELVTVLLLPGIIVVSRNARHIAMSGFATVIPQTQGDRRRVSQDTRRQLAIGVTVAIFGTLLTLVATSALTSSQ